jgi:ectoine hydroxylase-related dioxygenase (phytanoyl-CoA dioxygenase family)
MTGTSSLRPEQLAEFDRRGVLRVAGLLSGDRVRRAREYVQDRLAPLGLWREGAWRLGDHPKPQWPDSGLKASKVIGNKHPDVEALIDEPALLAAVDVLLEGHAFDREIFKRPQLLISLPNADNWTAPTDWHVDCPRLASGRRPGVQLFTFLDTVEPRGGGTLVIAGSHRLFNEGRFILAKELGRLLRREDFFRKLCSEGPGGRHNRAHLLNHAGAVGNVALEVVELTGAPGDAYLIDLRVVHAVAPNAADRTRMMATHRFWRADVVQELAQAHGWE